MSSGNSSSAMVSGGCAGDKRWDGLESALEPKRDPGARGGSATCLVGPTRHNLPLMPLHLGDSGGWGAPHDRCRHLHAGKAFLRNPVPVLNKRDGHNAGCLHPMYRMMFLRGGLVTSQNLS